MNHLFRDRAPITEAGWGEIEKEANRTLRALLAARRVVDFKGPLGWGASDVELGRAELDAIDRSARDPDLASVTAAAREIAIAEDRAIFHGYAAAQITGICQVQAAGAVPLGASHADYPGAVSTAPNKLRDDGVEGPFAVVLSERLYKDLASSTDQGYPILNHVQRLIDGDVVWAPGLDGGAVISRRGGDFELSVGQDFSIGYLDHDAERVRLYIEESFTFLILSRQAAIPLTSGGKKR